MPYNSDQQGDFEKLQMAFQEITSKFGSVESFLEAIGLSDMPQAQLYGILFGCIVFILTVSTVLALLFFGGSFQRIVEQSQPDAATANMSAEETRMNRALLLERLLDSRQYLFQRNYNEEDGKVDTSNKKNGCYKAEIGYYTNLTKMLLNVKPPSKDGKEEEQSKANLDTERLEEIETYKQNYVIAYRKCQDKPGGAVMSGRPEARFEAYGRSYAGCGGPHVNASYKRSYARIYEALACESHKTDDKYQELYDTQPEIIIGSTVRLEALNAKEHLGKVYDCTNGEIYHDKKSYNPVEVWGFLNDGPFDTPEALYKSSIFQYTSKPNTAAFCIKQNLTDRVIGVITLSNDDPQNLSIQLDAPIVHPAYSFNSKYSNNNASSKETLEACYLLMDRLFAYGYRRIQYCIDSQDRTNMKLADRLGFTFEGCLLKHMIVKESSRDSNVYGMLNSDWDQGARIVLYRKIYGTAAAKRDIAMNKKEEELDIQNKFLADQKLKEEEEQQQGGDANGGNDKKNL